MKSVTYEFPIAQFINLSDEKAAKMVADYYHTKIVPTHTNDSYAHGAFEYCINELGEKIFVTYFIYEKIFIHIPKCGGKYFWYNFDCYRNKNDHVTFNSHHTKTKDIVYEERRTRWNKHHISTPRTITVVRNPFSWLVSIYFHRKEDILRKIPNSDSDELNFAKFLKILCTEKRGFEEVFPFHDGMTAQLFNSEGELMVKNIVYFEKLTSVGCENYLKTLGIRKRSSNEDYNLYVKTCMKDSHRYKDNFKISRDYKPFYNEELIKLVNEKFKFDLNFLGYDFHGLTHDSEYLDIRFKKHGNTCVVATS